MCGEKMAILHFHAVRAGAGAGEMGRSGGDGQERGTWVGVGAGGMGRWEGGCVCVFVCVVESQRDCVCVWWRVGWDGMGWGGEGAVVEPVVVGERTEYIEDPAVAARTHTPMHDASVWVLERAF